MTTPRHPSDTNFTFPRPRHGFWNPPGHGWQDDP